MAKNKSTRSVYPIVDFEIGKWYLGNEVKDGKEFDASNKVLTPKKRANINGQRINYMKDASGKMSYIKISREFTSYQDDGSIVVPLAFNVGSLTDELRTALTDIDKVTVSGYYEAEQLTQQTNHGIVTYGNNEIEVYKPGPGVVLSYTDLGTDWEKAIIDNLLCLSVCVKPTKALLDKVKKVTTEVITITSNPINFKLSKSSGGNGYDLVEYTSGLPVILEWTFKKQVKLDFSLNIQQISSAVNTLVRFNFSLSGPDGLEMPKDFTIGDYITPKIEKDDVNSVVNIQVEGNSITISSVTPCTGKIIFGVNDKFVYDVKQIEIPYKFVRSGTAGGPGEKPFSSNKVKIQSNEGGWLTLNFDVKPTELRTELKALGDNVLTPTRFNNILRTIEEGKKNNNISSLLLPTPNVKINNKTSAETNTNDRVIIYNDFTLELLTPPTPLLKNKVYGIEVLVLNEDGTLPVGLYPTQQAAEIRGFLLHSPTVGLHKCKLFGLNYDAKQVKGLDTNMLRYDDGINALIDKEEVNDKGIAPYILKVRYVGEIVSDWSVFYVNFIKNIHAPFWYRLTEPIESSSDFELSGCVKLEGKTIDLLKTSSTIILEEANNTTSNPITTGKSITLKQIAYEVHEVKDYNSAVVYNLTKDILNSKIEEEDINFRFEQLSGLKDKKLRANVQYYFTVRLLFEHTDPTTNNIVKYEVTPYHNGTNLSNVESYGLIPFNINNFRSVDDIQIECLAVFTKDDAKIFTLNGNIDVIAFNKKTEPVVVDKALYSIKGYTWTIVGLGKNSDFNHVVKTTDRTLTLNMYLKDGDYEVRVSADTDRFDLLYLNKTSFKINNHDVELPEDEIDPETIYKGEYDRLTSVKAQSEGWRFYGEILPEKFQDERVNYTGRWTEKRNYTIGDEVNKNGSLYICVKDTPIGSNYDFRVHFRGMNTKQGLELYKSGLISPQEVLNRLGMDSNYTNLLQPNKNNPSYNHEQRPVSWLKVKNPQGEMLYISKMPVLKNVSLNDLVRADMLHPYQRTIRIGGNLYYPRWLIENATYPVEPLLEDFKNRADYFTTNKVSVSDIVRNEQTAINKFLNGQLHRYTNNEMGIISSKYSEFIYNKDFPKQLKYNSGANGGTGMFEELKVSSGDKVIEGIRLVLERIPDDERPHKFINPAIPGNNKIVSGSYDPFADVAFLDYVEIDKFLDMGNVLEQLNFLEGTKVQSFGYYKFYHQGQILFIADGLNVKDITLERLERYNLVHYSPKVQSYKKLQTDVGRVCYNGLPYSVSMLKVTDGTLILSEKKSDTGLYNIFTSVDTSLDFKLSQHASFTHTVIGSAVSQTPIKLSEGYKGSMPLCDISRTVANIGSGSIKEGVMTRTKVKDTDELVTQLESDLFRISKMNIKDKGRVLFVLSVPATVVEKNNNKK